MSLLIIKIKNHRGWSALFIILVNLIISTVAITLGKFYVLPFNIISLIAVIPMTKSEISIEKEI